MDKKRRKGGLYSKILMMFFVVILLPAVFTTWAVVVAQDKESLTKAVEENGKNMTISDGILRSRFSAAENIALNFTLDDKIINYFRGLYYGIEYESDGEDLRKYTLDSISAAYRNQNVHITKCYFIFNSDKIAAEYERTDMLISGGAVLDYEGYLEFLNSGEYKRWLPVSEEFSYGYITPAGVQPIASAPQTTLYIKMSRGEEFFGCIAVAVSIRNLTGDLEDIFAPVDVEFGLYDINGAKLYGESDFGLSPALLKNNTSGTVTAGKKVVSYTVNTGTGTVTAVRGDIKTDFMYLVSPLLTVLLSTVVFLIIYFLIKRTFGRIGAMMALMDKAAAGGLSERIPVDKDDEIGKIASDFNKMMIKLDEQVQITISKETEQTRAMFLALQHQINPHFLFNMLEIFRNKFVLDGRYDTSDAMADFGKILRYNIKGGTITTVRQEISMAKKFVALARLKYQGERVELVIDKDRAVDDHEIIKFIIQPVIENCLEHGKIEKAPFTITIKTKADGDYIFIEVSDNGKGFDPRVKKQLEEAFLGGGIPQNSIGLLNVHRRLRLYYGDDCGITIGQTDGRGAKVILTLKKTPPKNGEQDV